MKLDKYRGIIPAFYTCYDKVGEVGEDEVWALTECFVDQGVKGVYVGRSSGECTYQSVEGKEKTLKAVMDKATGCPTVIAHVACNNIRDSRILAAHTQDLSAGGIMTIPPVYFKLPKYSVAGYQDNMSEAAPETDFIICNIPRLADTTLTTDLLKTMLLNSRVAGVKNSSIPVQDIQMFRAETMKTRQGFIVFDSPDEQLVSSLTMGADGEIGGTCGAVPELFLKTYELVSEDRIAETRTIQYKANEVIYKLCSGTYNICAMMKEVLRINKGIDIGEVRKPLTDLYGSDRAIAGGAAVMIEDAKERYC